VQGPRSLGDVEDLAGDFAEDWQCWPPEGLVVPGDRGQFERARLKRRYQTAWRCCHQCPERRR
jgi:hypothetical protein